MISEVVTVTTSAQLVVVGGPHSDPRSVLMKVPAGGATVYLGGANVTTVNGYPLVPGEVFSGDLVAPDDLYVIASGSQAVNVLRGE